MPLTLAFSHESLLEKYRGQVRSAAEAGPLLPRAEGITATASIWRQGLDKIQAAARCLLSLLLLGQLLADPLAVVTGERSSLDKFPYFFFFFFNPKKGVGFPTQLFYLRAAIAGCGRDRWKLCPTAPLGQNFPSVQALITS